MALQSQFCCNAPPFHTQFPQAFQMCVARVKSLHEPCARTMITSFFVHTGSCQRRCIRFKKQRQAAAHRPAYCTVGSEGESGQQLLGANHRQAEGQNQIRHQCSECRSLGDTHDTTDKKVEETDLINATEERVIGLTVSDTLAKVH